MTTSLRSTIASEVVLVLVHLCLDSFAFESWQRVLLSASKTVPSFEELRTKVYSFDGEDNISSRKEVVVFAHIVTDLLQTLTDMDLSFTCLKVSKHPLSSSTH
ncbi:hypothetical protein L2E82_32545 [Cichorium intybus]|uniref:Uncharacterized protein n=1 Tax=Cichorium intybus TaxID=13427 RepID=A0ACB9BG68_CICIN|nr:hypothetical protein L2E82_32545 [Cichorium intybus]